VDFASDFALLALSLSSFSAHTFALAVSRSATTSCKLTLFLVSGCILSVQAFMSPISCKRLESLNGIGMFSTLRAAARDPTLLALWDLYSGVNIRALKLVSGLGRFSMVVTMLSRVIHSFENRPPVSLSVSLTSSVFSAVS
jgi:hypothetical protein